jgi:PAS domain S-box-containing protein
MAATQQAPTIGLQRQVAQPTATHAQAYHKNQQAIGAMTPLMTATIPNMAPSMGPSMSTNFPVVSASDTDSGGGLDSIAMAHQKKRTKRGGTGTAATSAAKAASVATNNYFPISVDDVADTTHHDHVGYHPSAAISEEEKLRHNRERNREHAKNTRLRKKAYVERLKISVDELCRERDGLLSERAAAAALLAETYSRRVDVLRSFFALRASYSPEKSQNRESWSGILDESSFTCRLPVTPYQSFPSSEVQVSNCQRTICGVDGMVGDAAANYVFLNSMVDRSRYPNGRMKFQYTLVTEESPSGGGGGGSTGSSNQLMARWSMSTLNAKKLGASNAHSSELSQRGMLLCKFNSAHKIVSLEIMFDVMAFMLQVKMAMGFDNFNDVVIPNTVQTCVGQGRQYDYPMVMTLANRPYTIVQVNERWENLTGYARSEVVGKKSCSILQRQDHRRHEENGELDRLMGPVLFQRPSCAMLTNYTKCGRRYRQYVTIYLLSTDSNISHYFGLTTFVQWMDAAADAPAAPEKDNVKTICKGAENAKAINKEAAATTTSDAGASKQKAVEFSVPLTTLTNSPTGTPEKSSTPTSIAK